VNSIAPGSAVSSESRPLAAVNMTNSEGLPQRVFVSFIWCTSVAVAGGEFAIQGYLRQTMVLHSGDVPCPALLCLQQHGLDTGNHRLFKKFDIGDIASR